MIDVLCGGSRCAGILDIKAGNPPGGLYAWIKNITAKKCPGGTLEKQSIDNKLISNLEANRHPRYVVGFTAEFQ